MDGNSIEAEVAVVVKDESSSFRSGATVIHSVSSTIEVEALAVRERVLLVKETGLRNVIVEKYSKSVQNEICVVGFCYIRPIINIWALRFYQAQV